MDSQSVKLVPMIGRHRGIDAHKKVNGRKREFLVDTGGRLWAVDVHSANQADGPASLPLIGDILWYGDRVEKVFGDRAYGGIFARELSKWGIDRSDFYDLCKLWDIVFIIFLTPFYDRVYSVDDFVSHRIQNQHFVLAASGRPVRPPCADNSPATPRLS